MRKLYDPWDRRLERLIDSVDWEVAARYLFVLIIGICIGIFLMMIQFQHQIISVLEGMQ